MKWQRGLATWIDIKTFMGMCPGFQKVLDAIQSGQVNCVIVEDLSRLGRHFLQTSEFVERIFPDMGVRLICINDNYDSSDADVDTNSLMLPLKMVMNDYYVKDIAKKIRSGINAKIEDGPTAGYGIFIENMLGAAG